MADQDASELSTLTWATLASDDRFIVSDNDDNEELKTLAKSELQTQLDGKAATTGDASIATVGTITTGTWTGTTIAVVNGGTGATTASGARTALGVAIGSDVQAWSDKLDEFAGLTFAKGDIFTFNGTDVIKLASSTDGHVLTLDSAQSAGIKWAASAGSGDMLASTYDAASVSEQLAGLTASQTLTNKTLTMPVITLNQGASPTPTSEGDIQWDTDDNEIVIGDGTGQKIFSDDSKLATAAQGTAADSALQDVVDDTTPQLGNNLDVNGNSIVSASAGDIALTPDTTGDVILDGLKWPQADGTVGQVLQTDGSAQLSWTSSPAINDVVKGVRNASGATLARGDVVYITGYHSGTDAPTVDLADSSSSATMPAFGIIQADIANNTNGFVVVLGRLGGFDTSSWTAGDALYVSETGTTGNTLTSTKPVGAAKVQSVGEVLRSHATLGEFEMLGAGRSNDIPNFTAADKFWYGGTGGVSTEGDYTTLAKTDAAETFTDNVTVQGQAYSETATLTDSATVATDCDNGNVFTVTLGGNRTLGAPSNLKDGATYLWIIKQDGTGSRTLAYNAVFKFPGGTAPTLSTGANDVDLMSGVSDGTNIYCVSQLDFS